MQIKIQLGIIAVLLLFGTTGVVGQKAYKMQPVQIQTRWLKDVSPTNALKEYPRPGLVRSKWVNLNDLWEYAITAKDVSKPSGFEGQILVPYPLESALSGVKEALLPTQHLWYKRKFKRPVLKAGEHVKLNFGAVDYEATVFVNGTEVGKHVGGYTEFSIDITAALRSGENELVVKVYDPSDKGVGPHGKQVLTPKDIYYTPSSGIWQTVWMEVVPASFIENLKVVPDIDKGIVEVTVASASQSEVSVLVDGVTVTGTSNKAIVVPIKNIKLWSPGNPNLYDLVVKMGSDEVNSYFGMRKISVGKDSSGVDRIMLNNRPYFNLGTLDQGFWPDGLYTAPTDEALRFDIAAIKAMGFNTIRKHIKVEPARWYYWADKLGILVWQDMVNPNQSLPEGSKAAFEKGVGEEIAQLSNHPSIVTWVLFNEKWGQYDQERLTKWIKSLDPTRLVNGHSGEYLYVNEKLRSPSPDAYVASDMTDVHSYPDPMNSISMDGKARVLGEFGGIGVFVPDHQWDSGSAWGYIGSKPADFAGKYRKMNEKLKELQAQGLSASIYTQPFDVEGEQNGLMTYDREVVKIPFAELRSIHRALNPDMGTIPEVTAKDMDLTDPVELYKMAKAEFDGGKKDLVFLRKLVMMAVQNGDLDGIEMYRKELVGKLGASPAPEDLNLLLKITKTSKDVGFDLLINNAAVLQKEVGERNFTVTMMNMIYQGDIAAFVEGGATPDWEAISAQIKGYGIFGEEILYRAKSLYFLNKKDWKNYSPIAKIYLEKYGKSLSDAEYRRLKTALDWNQ